MPSRRQCGLVQHAHLHSHDMDKDDLAEQCDQDLRGSDIEAGGRVDDGDALFIGDEDEACSGGSSEDDCRHGKGPSGHGHGSGAAMRPAGGTSSGNGKQGQAQAKRTYWDMLFHGRCSGMDSGTQVDDGLLRAAYTCWQKQHHGGPRAAERAALRGRLLLQAPMWRQLLR
jgi:hypothetical protein